MESKMENQVLSIEQMLILKELGIDTSKASMYIWLEDHGDIVLSNGNAPQLPCNTILTFTLQDILDILPEYIYDDDYMKCYFSLERWGGKYFICYDRLEYEETIELYSVSHHSSLGAAYQALLWCIENGHIKTNSDATK